MYVFPSIHGLFDKMFALLVGTKGDTGMKGSRADKVPTVGTVR